MGDNSDGGGGQGGDLTTTRDVWATTPLGAGVMALERMDGHEALAQPFTYNLMFLSTDWNVDLSKLLGQSLTVHVNLPGGGTRHFNGIATQATHLDVEDGYARYAVTLQPWLSLLDYRADCRIYQNQSIPEIVKEVFRRADFSDFEDLLDDGSYGKLEFVVQYRESDFNFVSRLMEEAGIYYYFKHDDSKHTLVLADSEDDHEPAGGYGKVTYLPQKEASRGDKEHLSAWTVVQQIRSGGYAATDFDFKAPRTALLSQLSQPQHYAHADGELFDYPGDFLKKSDGDVRVKIRLEERQYEHALVQASGDVRGIGCGNVFTLTDYPREDQNKEYLIIGASYSINVGQYESGGGGGEEFRSGLTLLDSKIPFRPAIRARKHRVEGPQTAIVVGPSGEEIHTDNFGRVMVQFHWDRYGMSDERSSCWVRVSQAWAGAKWGAVHIPRIGQEVIVDFLEGDPDRPIITGRVYNADNMPPYDLPANKTQSGLKSRSSKGGAPSNFNEIRFEDKKGSEELHIQAEKDETKLVKNNQTANIGVDRSLTVGSDETVSIGKNRTEKVGADESVSIGANQTLKVGANRTKNVSGDESVTIGAIQTVTIGAASVETVGAARAVTIGAAYQITVGAAMNETVGAVKSESVGGSKSVDVGGGYTETVGKDKTVTASGGVTVGADKAIALTAGTDFNVQAGKKATIEATDELTLVCGDATIVLKKSGDITINGAKVQVTASGDLVLKGSKLAGN
ncbi:MAG TPA: type VI secretion system tip protein TssI/VgrG [Polyangia bacterium]|nr:type VI secretion system tip protein TssI/VgrG [Polyangia bacterium]